MLEAEASENSKHPAPAPQSDMQGPVSTLAKVRGEKKPRPGWIRKSTEMVEMPIAYMQDLVVQPQIHSKYIIYHNMCFER
jgi:hypothetical protein